MGLEIVLELTRLHLEVCGDYAQRCHREQSDVEGQWARALE